MKEIRVKVQAGMKKELVEERGDDRFLVLVKAPREEGRANERVRELIAKHFRVQIERVVITRGKDQSSKTLRIYEEEIRPTRKVSH